MTEPAGKRIAVLAVAIVAALGGALLAVAVSSSERRISAGTIRLSVDPGHRGALDMYAPLVDWGVRFPAVRLPARLRLELRTVDRRAVERVASGGEVRVERLRQEATDEIARFIRRLVVVAALAALGAGMLVALAMRGLFGTSVGWPIAGAAAAALACGVLLALLLPPRGPIDDPEYYAHGPDIPRALAAIEGATESAESLSEELDAQLVGLARLVVQPGSRPELLGLPRVTVASDVHNNFLALPSLERAAAGGPVIFAGDLTDSGSPLETSLVRNVVDTGRPFVMVSGNHDSDVLVRRLADEGAVVLTERGRLRADGSLGPLVARVGGLRIAGYSDPFERRRADRFRATRPPEPTDAQKRAFAEWVAPLVGRVDVVAVHAPALAELALERLRRRPPREPIAFAVGHTHRVGVEADVRNVVVVNGGTLGGGGTGNLDEHDPLGLAVMTYDATGGFRPLAVDLVELDPGDGSARAERHLIGPESR